MSTNVSHFPSGEELIEREADALRRQGHKLPPQEQVLAEDPTELRHTILGKAIVETVGEGE